MASAVREFARTTRRSPQSEPTRVVGAHLTLTPTSLARLLSITGSESDFILSSLDGSTSVKVRLAVADVPDAAISLAHGVTLDWAHSSLSAKGRTIALTRMELRLLGALLEHAPHTAPRAHLIARLWPRTKVNRDSEGALAVWICALRRRFGAVGLTNAIQTTRNTGYALTV